MENITIVMMICNILDEIIVPLPGCSRRELINFVPDRPGHDQRYAIDFNKLQEELNWTPRESFTSGLRKTIGWYLKNREWIDRVRTGAYRKWMDEQYGL